MQTSIGAKSALVMAEDCTMIDGLKLTFSGGQLRELLEARAAHHEAHAHWWAHEERRAPEDQTEDAPLLPDEMCRHEAERHTWRAEVLRVDTGEGGPEIITVKRK